MKKNILISLFVLSLLGMVGCGALNETKELTQQANEGVAHGNQLQEAMLQIQFQMLDYMKNTETLMREMAAMTKQMADDTNSNMEQSNALMKKTLEYMRMQAVATSMAGMVAPENTEFLNPPTKMEPYADTLGKQATTQELIMLAYILYEDFLYSDASKNQKIIFSYAFSLIGGFMPQEKMNELIETHVINHDRYEETMYALLYGRYESIRDLLFKPAAIDAIVFNVATLQESVLQFVKMKHVASLPFVNLVRLKIPALFVNRTIDQNEVKALGQSAIAKYNANLSAQDLARPEVQALLLQLKY